MIPKRTFIFTALHEQTGLTLRVYRVDCFVEVRDTFGNTSFQFYERFHETDTGQRVTFVEGVAHAVVIELEKGNQWVRILT